MARDARARKSLFVSQVFPDPLPPTIATRIGLLFSVSAHEALPVRWSMILAGICKNFPASIFSGSELVTLVWEEQGSSGRR